MSDSAQVGNWIQAGATVLGFMVLWLKLSGKGEKRDIGPQPFEVRPSPEFAPKDHIHPHYITRAECHEAHVQSSQSETSKIEQVQRQIDHLANDMKQTLFEHNKSAEARSSTLHARIDPISKLAQSTTDRLNDHFEDHRNGRFDNAAG